MFWGSPQEASLGHPDWFFTRHCQVRVCKGFTPTPKENLKGGNWSQELQDAFVKAKSALFSAVSLTHSSPSAEVLLVTDASNTHVGAALQQKESGGWRLLVFVSAKLSATQQRYSAFNRELLGVFLALRHFRFESEGRKFNILTDHLPLGGCLMTSLTLSKTLLFLLGSLKDYFKNMYFWKIKLFFLKHCQSSIKFMSVLTSNWTLIHEMMKIPFYFSSFLVDGYPACDPWQAKT